MSEIKLLNVLKTRKILRTLIHLNKKILPQFFAKYPTQKYKEKNSLKIWSKNSRHIDEPFKLRNIYCTKKLSYYCNTKDKVPEYLKYHLVYEFCSKYIGKTDQNFGTCLQEHSGSEKKSLVSNHLLECEHFTEVNLHSLPPSNNSVEYLMNQ